MKAVMWRRAAAIALPVLAIMLARDGSRVLHDHQQVELGAWIADLAIPALIGGLTVLVARLIAPRGAYEALLEERAEREAAARDRR